MTLTPSTPSIYKPSNQTVTPESVYPIITPQLIDKEFLSQKSGISHKKFKDLRLENMWVDQMESTNSARIDLLYSEIAGGDVNIIHLKLVVYDNGNYDLEEV